MQHALRKFFVQLLEGTSLCSRMFVPGRASTDTNLLFLCLGLHVGFEEFLLDIARHRLVVSEVHSECSTA